MEYNKPLWLQRRGRVPKNVGYVTSSLDVSFACSLQRVGCAVRVGSYSDLFASRWRRFDADLQVGCVEEFVVPDTPYSSGVDALVLDGEVSDKRLVRELLVKLAKPTFYLPRIREEYGAVRAFGVVRKGLLRYDPSLSL